MSDDTPTGPFSFACGWCDFTATDPGAIVTHMISSGHGLSPEVRADMIESGLPGELEDVLGKLQRGEVRGTPISEDSDDEPG